MAAESDDGFTDENRGDPPNQQVADPEEYNQTQRLRAINRARQRVEDTLEQSMVREVTDPEFSEDDRRQVVRAVVYSYLSNVFWLMVRADRGDLVNDVHLGTVELDPPPEFVELTQDRDQSYPRVIGSPDIEPETFSIKGLREYLGAPRRFEYTWTIQLQQRHAQPEPVSQTRGSHMPVNISKNAFHAANRFCSETGIDIEIMEDDGDAGFDYSDILKTGPPGNGDPPEIRTDGSRRSEQ